MSANDSGTNRTIHVTRGEQFRIEFKPTEFYSFYEVLVFRGKTPETALRLKSLSDGDLVNQLLHNPDELEFARVEVTGEFGPQGPTPWSWGIVQRAGGNWHITETDGKISAARS